MDSPPDSAPARAEPDMLDVRVLLAGVLAACDVVFGGLIISLSVAATYLCATGQAHLATPIALWSIPAVNFTWSFATRHQHRRTTDLWRCLICMPLTAFIYVSETGVLDQMWLPALVMAVGCGLSFGLSSGRGAPGCVIAIAYGATLFATAARHDGRIEVATINDALGIAITGCITSLVCSQLARTLEEARRQRDAAHGEMEARMEIEVELRQAQKLEAVGRLAAGIAHEINTPVQFVSDSLQFVQSGVIDVLALVGGTSADDVDLPYLREHLPRALERSREGLDRVAAIVGAMKEFAHPETRNMAAADLNRAIASTLTIARNEYKYVAELKTQLGELPLVECHVGELNQAVLNIVVNAAHAIGDVVRGTGAKGELRVRTYREGDEVVIAIADTGGGIPPEAREHIFEPFFTTKPVGQGTGQGLAIARSVIVDKHHGRLEFETAVGRGTTFFIHLPVAAH